MERGPLVFGSGGTRTLSSISLERSLQSFKGVFAGSSCKVRRSRDRCSGLLEEASGVKRPVEALPRTLVPLEQGLMGADEEGRRRRGSPRAGFAMSNVLEEQTSKDKDYSESQ